MKNLVLVGFMGSGKSTVGRAAASQLGMKFVDVDGRIEEREGMSVSEIFEKKGESYFRDVESEVIASLVREEKQVIATGGGAILREINLKRLSEGGFLIYLRVDAETALERTSRNSHRPLLKGDAGERIRTLLAERGPLYESLPHAVDTVHRTPHEVAQAVIRLYRSH